MNEIETQKIKSTINTVVQSFLLVILLYALYNLHLDCLDVLEKDLNVGVKLLSVSGIVLFEVITAMFVVFATLLMGKV